MSEESKSAERDNAEFNSRSCILCGGNGMAIVFHRHWTGERIGVRDGTNSLGEPAQIPFAAEVAAHCICPLGRWMRDRAPDYLKRRIPDGADIVNGRSWYSFDQPSLEETSEPSLRRPA